MHYIYAYENRLDGKVYIGQTNDLYKRDKSHQYNQHNLHIDNALRLHGRENFDYWVINETQNIDQANQEEIFWILTARYLLGKDMVYNKSDGGEASMRGRKHSEETKKNMSAARKGAGNPNYGKKFPGRINSGCFKPGLKPTHNHKGKTWRLIDGKRVWMERESS